MRIIDFYGVLPKVNRRKLQLPYCVSAVNVDLYGARLQGLPSPVRHGTVVDVHNQPISDAATMKVIGTLTVGFRKTTFVADDPQNRMGDNTFLFVEDGKLYRTSPSQITAGCAPVEVGIKQPCEAPTAAILEGAGCAEEVPPVECDDIERGTCDYHIPPTASAYRYTYTNACGEESAPSPPSAVIDVPHKAAVAVVAPANDVPANAVTRRWYRSVATSKGEVVWMLVGEIAIASTGYIDNKCPGELEDQLLTEHELPPPDCLRGVANFGDNAVVVWTNKQLFVSNDMLPNAYDYSASKKVMYNIVGAVGFIDNVESEHTYKLAVLTDGKPYTVFGTGAQDADVREIQDWQPCASADSICLGEGLVYYVSEHGVVAYSGSNAKVITADYFTENEWKELFPEAHKLCFWSGRLWGFHKLGGYQMRVSNSDVDRVEFFTELSDTYSACAASANTAMFVVPYGTSAVWRWCADATNRMRYTWRSRVETQSGLWYPTAIKIEAASIRQPAVSDDARTAYNLWVATHKCDDGFFDANPCYARYMSGLAPTILDSKVAISADDSVVYERAIRFNQPMRIPRVRRALHWDITVESNREVYEVHMQSSIEDMIQEGGAT